MIAVLLALLLVAPQDPALAARAWQALQARNAAEAQRLFDELTRATPSDARAWVGYAAAALLAGRDHDARPRLERALALDPADAEASLLLADIFFRQARLDDAVRTLEQAEAAGARGATIASRLARLRSERDVNAGLRQTGSDRFIVLFEGAPAQDLAAAVVAKLDAAWDRVSRSLFVAPLSAVTVTLYTGEQFVDITRAPAWAAAAYDGRIRLPVRGALDDAADLERVLTHELAHAFVRAAAPRNIPAWLDEGIASVMEPRDLRWARDELARSGRLLPPASLMASFRALPAGQARLAYAQSALMVRAMIDANGEGALNALLADLGRGVPFDTAFRNRLFVSWPEFAARFASQAGVPYDHGR